jgi:hypothetical protein
MLSPTTKQPPAYEPVVRAPPFRNTPLEPVADASQCSESKQCADAYLTPHIHRTTSPLSSAGLPPHSHARYIHCGADKMADRRNIENRKEIWR